MSRVRDCAGEDLCALLALEQSCFADPWSEQALRDTLQNRQAVLLAEEDGDRIVGYLGIYLLPDGAEIVRLAVAPAFRRQGTATRLIREAFRRAEQAGAGSVWLEVRSSNAPARALYERNGFRQEGLRKNYYRHPTEDAILMTRILPGADGPSVGQEE